MLFLCYIVLLTAVNLIKHSTIVNCDAFIVHNVHYLATNYNRNVLIKLTANVIECILEWKNFKYSFPEIDATLPRSITLKSLSFCLT